MSEPTRRDVIKTGAAALAAGVAGCSDSEGNNQPENTPQNNTTATGTETPVETQEQEQEASVGLEDENLFNLVIDPNELYDADVVYDKIAAPPPDSPGGSMYSEEPVNRELGRTMFDIWKVKDTYNNVSGIQREKIDEIGKAPMEETGKPLVYLPEDRTMQNIEVLARGKADITTVIYDDTVEEDHIVSNLHNRNFRPLTDLDWYDWDVYQGDVGPEDDLDIYTVAVKDNKAIFVPDGDKHSGNIGEPQIISDSRTAMRVALDTHEDQLPSYPEEPDDMGDEALNKMIDYLEGEGLGPGEEDVHRIQGGAYFSEEPEEEAREGPGPAVRDVGLLSTITYEDNNMTVQGPGVVYKPDSANELEIKEYPDREKEPVFYFE